MDGVDFYLEKEIRKEKNSMWISILQGMFGKGDEAAGHKQKQELLDDIHKCTMTVVKARDL